jgi:hypothetical protein
MADALEIKEKELAKREAKVADREATLRAAYLEVKAIKDGKIQTR